MIGIPETRLRHVVITTFGSLISQIQMATYCLPILRSALGCTTLPTQNLRSLPSKPADTTLLPSRYRDAVSIRLAIQQVGSHRHLSRTLSIFCGELKPIRLPWCLRAVGFRHSV